MNLDDPAHFCYNTSLASTQAYTSISTNLLQCIRSVPDMTPCLCYRIEGNHYSCDLLTFYLTSTCPSFIVSSRAIMDIFSLKFLKDIEISLTKSKGGSFYIRPGNGLGRIVIKSISVPEYNIIKEFLPQYYCHLLMNPNTYLVPILGAYKLKLLENEDITPIAFVLMRDVLDINRNQIGPYDRLYSFEFKGK